MSASGPQPRAGWPVRQLAAFFSRLAGGHRQRRQSDARGQPGVFRPCSSSSSDHPSQVSLSCESSPQQDSDHRVQPQQRAARRWRGFEGRAAQTIGIRHGQIGRSDCLLGEEVGQVRGAVRFGWDERTSRVLAGALLLVRLACGRFVCVVRCRHGSGGRGSVCAKRLAPLPFDVYDAWWIRLAMILPPVKNRTTSCNMANGDL